MHFSVNLNNKPLFLFFSHEMKKERGLAAWPVRPVKLPRANQSGRGRNGFLETVIE